MMKLNITIEGKPGNGAISVARLIAGRLKDLGVSVTNHANGELSSDDLLCDPVERVKEFASKLEVEIVTEQQERTW